MSSRVAGAAAVALAAIEMAIDWGTWVSLDVSIVYGLPLVLAAIARSRRLLWILAAVLTATTIAVYFAQMRTQQFFWSEPFFVNRLLSVSTLLIIAVMLHAWTVALDDLADHARSLASKNAELAMLRQAAEEASTRKSKMLASLSHDIRSPLNAIGLLAGVIHDAVLDPSLTKDVPTLADKLQVNTLSLNELVQDILDLSSFDTGRAAVHESDFAVADLLAEEAARVEALAHARGLSLHVDSSSPGLRLRTDRTKLARVLGNLLSNALKFTQAGSVDLAAGMTGNGRAAITVRDTGSGIPEQELSRIFDEFVQMEGPGPPSSEPGWGLGLAISRRLIDMIGGTIEVESEVDEGSAFTVYLPASAVVMPEAHQAPLTTP